MSGTGTTPQSPSPSPQTPQSSQPPQSQQTTQPPQTTPAQETTASNVTVVPRSKIKNLAFIIATAGIIPFFICSLGIATHVKQSPFLLKILLAYSAIILSFSCGMHWGIAVSQDTKFPKLSRTLIIESIIIALCAWVILLFIPVTNLQLYTFIAAFGIIWIIDLLISFKRMIPLWFLGLRSYITVLIVGLLLFAVYTLHK